MFWLRGRTTETLALEEQLIDARSARYEAEKKLRDALAEVDRLKAKLTIHCSFCAKSQQAVERLIAGPKGIFICNECNDLCTHVFKAERAKDREEKTDG